MKKRAAKPPRIPRCLCTSFINYVLQVSSPSRLFAAAIRGDNEEANLYFRRLSVYRFACYERMIDERKATRGVYKQYCRMKKKIN